MLRPKGDFGVDADVAVFLNANGVSQYDLSNLHDRIRRTCGEDDPTKKPEDFTIQPRTLGIEFRDSGLAMDLVPLMVIDGPGDYGWQPSSRGDAPVKTSVTKQLEFIRARREAYANFAALIRMLKYWRNFHELDDSLRSFTIELIVSHLQDARGSPSFAGRRAFAVFPVRGGLAAENADLVQGMRHAQVFPQRPGRNTRSMQC